MAESIPNSTLLDDPNIQRFIFYPSRSIEKLFMPRNARNYLIEVEPDIKIGCRLYTKDAHCPTILYFHGNGEIVNDYDSIAPLYNERAINLFVADYRGYGFSNGKPTLGNILRDCHPIFKEFKDIIKREGYAEELFVMGRSLGSITAVEIAKNYQQQLKGLIIDSGFANPLRWISTNFDKAMSDAAAKKLECIVNEKKIRSVTIPTLIMHGRQDSIVPPEEGKALYENTASPDKELFIIPGADHNNMIFEEELYFGRIESFVKKVKNKL